MRVLFVLFLLTSCSNLEFVYKKNIKNPALEATTFAVSGDQFNIVTSQLIKLLGKNKSSKYVLEVSATEEITNEIVGSDSTTLKYNVSHTINYKMKNLEKNCLIASNKITTMSNFDSKSAGYNFGSDISKSKTIENNIYANINNFLGSIGENLNNNKCVNES